MIKKYKILFSVLAGFSLSACSHENPLLTQPEKDSAKFLRDASSYAEKVTDYRSYISGDMYGECMLGHVSDEDICPALMKSMVEYAKKSDSSFGALTVADLENKTAFHRLHKDYAFS